MNAIKISTEKIHSEGVMDGIYRDCMKFVKIK